MAETKVFEFPADFSEQHEKSNSNTELFTYYKKMLDGYETKDDEADIDWLRFDHYLFKGNRDFYIRIKYNERSQVYKVKTEFPAKYLFNIDSKYSDVEFKMGINKTHIVSASLDDLKRYNNYLVVKYYEDDERVSYIKIMQQITAELFRRLDVKGESSK